jgi:hypothetical protein
VTREYVIERNSRDGGVQGVRLRTAERSQNAKEKYMAVVEEREVELTSDIASHIHSIAGLSCL